MNKLSSQEIWWLAVRPKTLWAGICPVMLGTAMAVEADMLFLPAALTCLCFAISIQIGTNFANDYFDCIKGSDTANRLGPLRVTQAGLIAPESMKHAFVGVFFVAFVFGSSLVFRGGWPIILLVIISIISGILYTAGPYPLGYIGLGDAFVLVFFGPVALAGTYYIQALNIPIYVVIAGLGPGFLSMAMLTINNLRDFDEDRSSGKRTLAVIFGRKFVRFEFLASIILAFLIPVYLSVSVKSHPWIIATSLVMLGMIPTIQTVLTKEDGPLLNRALGSMGKFLLFYTLVFSIGWLIDS